ncbi:hypothetical protein VNO77_13902 [Canavalia gladiata]|uniref:Uncharacterized protein n=1 Tax=Canavalia gladiata TaxID=3824 RepID=A0AAN9M2X8_CANGL
MEGITFRRTLFYKLWFALHEDFPTPRSNLLEHHKFQMLGSDSREIIEDKKGNKTKHKYEVHQTSTKVL